MVTLPHPLHLHTMDQLFQGDVKHLLAVVLKHDANCGQNLSRAQMVPIHPQVS